MGGGLPPEANAPPVPHLHSTQHTFSEILLPRSGEDKPAAMHAPYPIAAAAISKLRTRFA
jgi:hypothetical protein